MPLGPGVKYRTIDRGNKMIRLAFKAGKVLEAKVIRKRPPKVARRKPLTDTLE